MTMLNETIGTMEYDNLIHDTYPEATVFAVTLAAVSAETMLKRGTVLARNADGKMVVLGSDVVDDAEEDETGSEGTATATPAVANCILANDCIAGTDEVDVEAYRTGHFNRNKLIVADGYELTADDEEALRSVGILLSDAMAY